MKAQESELNAMYPAKKRHCLLQLGDELFERDAAIGGSETLSELISVAAATLDSDRATARACIERAAELLSVTAEARPAPATAAIRGGLAPWQQRNVDAYVAANIGCTIRVRDLARVARLSVGHFFRAFRESFGEPPFAHITRQRIERAQSLMLGSRASLSQIAFDCGMCDQAHFTRVFRRIVGINPGVWRRQSSARDANRNITKGSNTTSMHRSSVQGGGLDPSADGYVVNT
jgi:AraC family transcriptional regulator